VTRNPREAAFAVGDRVRIVALDNPYTGCRGTIAESPYAVPEDDSGLPLGYYVEVDGEKGRPRPFLGRELESVRVARVRPPEPTGTRRPREGSQSA
jgi:hypothetical protein